MVGASLPKWFCDCLLASCVCSPPSQHYIPPQSQVCHVVFENVNTLGNFIKILTLSWVCIIRIEISWEYFSQWCCLYFLVIMKQRAVPIQSSLKSCTLKWNQRKILISTCPEFSLVYFGTNILNYPFVLCATYVLTGLSPTPGTPVNHVLSEPLMPPVTRTTASGQYALLPILHCQCFPQMGFSYWLSLVSAWNFRTKMCKDPFDLSSEKQWCEMSICCTLDLCLFLNTL